MFTRLPVDASDRDQIGEPWNDVTSPSLRFTRSCRKKEITLKIHKKSRFQPNEKIFVESCSVRYKDLLRAKNFFGVIGTLTSASLLGTLRVNFFRRG